MRHIQLIVPVGADEQKIVGFSARRETLEQLDRGLVEPLQVIQKQNEGTTGLSKHLNETAEYRPEAVAGLERWQVRQRRLFTDDEREVGQHIHDQLTVGAERLLKCALPRVEFILPPRQE